MRLVKSLSTWSIMLVSDHSLPTFEESANSSFQGNVAPIVSSQLLSSDGRLLMFESGASEYFKRTENIAGVKVRDSGSRHPDTMLTIT